MAPRQLPTRLLVDLPNWVGDQMMAMPAISRLVEGNIGGETVLHTRPPMKRLLAAVFPRTTVVASPRKSSPFVSARELCGSNGRYGVGVTLRNAARAKILTRLGAKWSIGSRGEGAFVLLSKGCPVNRARHQVHDSDSILTALGLEGSDPLWRPALPPTLHVEGEEILRGVGVDRHRAVGLAPTTARGEAKRWPVERYGMIASRIIARGYQPVVVVGPGERSTAENLCGASGHCLPVVGENQDVAGLAAVVTGFRVLVGNDSGPMQVASRFGIPVVGIFGPTEIRRTRPLGTADRVVCGSSGQTDCIRNISTEEVDAALSELLGEITLELA